MMKRCPIVFNMENPHQRELYEWCMEQTTNFSGWGKDVLFTYKETKSRTAMMPTAEAEIFCDDTAAMSSLL